MKPLPTQWTRAGYVSRVIKRVDNVVMIRLGQAECYEVAVVQHHNGRTLPTGAVLEAAEYMPSNEEWGRQGWTFCDEGQARAKFASLLVPKPAKRGPNSRQPVPTPRPRRQSGENVPTVAQGRASQ